MMHPVPCPECDSKGLKASLEEAIPGEIYVCPQCGSQFKHVNEPIQGMIQGCGFGSFMGICSSVLFFLFIVVSPDNPPWYHFVIGVIVLLGIYALLSKTVFSRMADSINMKNLKKVNEQR